MRSKGATGGRRTGLSNLAKSRMKAKLRGRMRYRLLLFLKSLLVATASLWHLWCFAPVEPSGAGRAQPALPLESAGLRGVRWDSFRDRSDSQPGRGRVHFMSSLEKQLVLLPNWSKTGRKRVSSPSGCDFMLQRA